MRPLRAVVLALLIVVPALAQDAEPELAPATKLAADLQAKADELLKTKKNEEALDTYKKLLAHLEAKKDAFPDFPESQQRAVRYHAHYNSCCAAALLGRRDLAFEELQAAIENGWYDWQHMEKDEDLASLRADARYKEKIAHLRGQDKETQKLAKFVKDTIKDKPVFEFDFDVTTIQSERLKLSDLKGKVVVLDCFGTWCPPCREEIPSFVKLHKESKERSDPVVIIGLCWERAEPNEAIEADLKDFIAKNEMGYPVVLMKLKDPLLDRIPDLRGFPTTIWIDKQGKVRAREEGLHTFEELEAVTKGLLEEAAAKPPAKDKPEKAPEKAPDKTPEKSGDKPGETPAPPEKKAPQEGPF